MGDFPSGQRGQTVNLLSFDFGGPNPPSPTKTEHQMYAFGALFFCTSKADISAKKIPTPPSVTAPKERADSSDR